MRGRTYQITYGSDVRFRKNKSMVGFAWKWQIFSILWLHCWKLCRRFPLWLHLETFFQYKSLAEACERGNGWNWWLQVGKRKPADDESWQNKCNKKLRLKLNEYSLGIQTKCGEWTKGKRNSKEKLDQYSQTCELEASRRWDTQSSYLLQNIHSWERDVNQSLILLYWNHTSW